jgi:hypothetical protein
MEFSREAKMWFRMSKILIGMLPGFALAVALASFARVH